MNTLMKFQAGQSASISHSALKSAVKIMDQAKNCAVLWFGEIYRRQLFRELGYSSITQYGKLELGFSPARTSDFVSICQKLKKLPLVEEEIREGKLGYTRARELVKVADSRNEERWLEVAHRNSRDELAQQVKQAQRRAKEETCNQPALIPETKPLPPAVPPVRVSLEMTPTQLAQYESLWEQIRKMGGVPGDKVETLLQVMECYVAGDFPGGTTRESQDIDNKTLSTKTDQIPRNYVSNTRPPVQIHVHQCPDCEKATVQTSRGEFELGRAEVDQALCDAQISQEGQRNSTTIPPRTRRFVLARDRHRCRRPGCDHSRFLEVHHIVPRAKGGTNQAENLITLCSACHGLVHELNSDLIPGNTIDPSADSPSA